MAEFFSDAAGFSLIELMLSIGLIAILSATMLRIANFTTTEKNLILAIDQVRQGLRSAQAYSLTIPNSNIKHICGFGLRVVNSGTQYEIFYTTATDAAWDANPINACSVCNTYMSGATVQCDGSSSLQTVDLQGNVTFINPDDDYAFFRAPYGDPASPRDFDLNGGNTPDISVKTTGKIE